MASSDQTDVVEIQDEEVNKPVSTEIPFALREFGEIPDGYVSVFIQVKKKELDWIAQHGFRTSDNQMAVKAPEVEKIYQEEAQKLGVRFDRTKVVFAYPKKPDQLLESLGFDQDRDLLIEVKVDPSKCLVADAGLYKDEISRPVITQQEADRINKEYEKNNSTRHIIGPEEAQRKQIDKYWGTAIPLAVYIRNGWNKTTREEHEFAEPSFPEVLIPDDINTNLIRAIPDYVPQEHDW